MVQRFVRTASLFTATLLISVSSYAADPGAFRQYLRSFAGDDPSVVSAVDLKKYMGLWYEIAHSPNFFQGGCIRSTAEYQIIDASTVSVHNICTYQDGTTKDIKGTATAPDASQPAKLKVDFGFAWDGDYWIIDLDPNYQWAIVSGPKKESLFILSRTAPMEPALLQSILDRLEDQGFKTDEFIFDQY